MSRIVGNVFFSYSFIEQERKMNGHAGKLHHTNRFVDKIQEQIEDAYVE